jgi:hypothetical protein
MGEKEGFLSQASRKKLLPFGRKAGRDFRGYRFKKLN